MELTASFSTETIIALLVILLSCLFVHIRGLDVKSAHVAPSIFTTIGIFATFVGIAVGLFSFDSKNIQGSIPALLDGLRTAFWASVFGIGAALTVKIRWAIWGPSKTKGTATTPQGASLDDVAAQLMAVQQALVGNDDSTLITQLRLGRQDSNDRMDRIRKVLDDFTGTMTENNSKALIEALEGVMRDFNAKINEQFGENFKQLNQAVGDILVWQQRYREQMAEMIVLQDRSTQSLVRASQHFENIVDNAEQYSQTAKDLGRLLQALAQLLRAMDSQSQSLQSSMTTLGELFVSASHALPDIEQRIVSFADQIARSTQQANEQIVSSTQSSADSLGQAVLSIRNGAAMAQETLLQSAQATQLVLSGAMEDMGAKIVESVRYLQDGSAEAHDSMKRAALEHAAGHKQILLDGQKILAEGLLAANDSMVKQQHDFANAQKTALIEVQKLLNDGILATNDGFNIHVQDMISKTKEQVAALDLALQEELTNSLNTLGRQLTALSQQFVSDYQPLTERLRDLLAVAGKV